MTNPQKILFCGPSDDQTSELRQQFSSEDYLVVTPENLAQGIAEFDQGNVSALVVPATEGTLPLALIQSGSLLEYLPHAVVVLDAELRIIWANQRLNQLCDQRESLIGHSFYDAFGAPEILGPDFSPFHTAFSTRKLAKSGLRVGDKNYFDVEVTPVITEPDDNQEPAYLVASVRDISAEVLQRQKLNAIYQAGLELGDLSPEEIYEMSTEDRIELLKAKILHYTQDLLEFETVEIRILDKATERLDVLLAVGMEQVATNRTLYAKPEGNGVTGFVAATGKSYLCEDTTHDPLYMTGAPDARSSLTVPLHLHDEVLGTFNVESPHAGAFDENDLHFLELFSREVAIALNTLELLVVEKMTTASASTELIMRGVVDPVDEILNDTAWILERYIGHEPNVCERLQRILKDTRHIKQLIQQVGDEIAPQTPHHHKVPTMRQVNPKLLNKRVLVVDSDATVRRAAHELLGRLGCEVETAHNGEEAFLMVRSFHYDVVIADIRLPDMNGYECFAQIREIHEHLPVILMTGFGYDPTHSIVKARQLGLKCVLYKPFRLDQLITGVEKAVSISEDITSETSN
ncbi:MAG: two-component system response regulator [Gimesia sp.]|uniref:Nitrogen regulation protein NR(I) n=1 Tax=Gimesia chilikensis TaxID=2605989 RepID=A0A517PV50_9PLAN|nr:response regulator [Gimesia chilikensis]MBN70195.1 two-component system response regulator [Gimesia sp.]MCR9230553.1 response regulator [bacterium]QDT23245.1 Nitrogen regulation protein NR(I) [Gimesia chilikensis]